MQAHLIRFTLLILLCPMLSWGQCFDNVLPHGGDCQSAQFLCGYNIDGFTGTLNSDPVTGDQPATICAGSGDIDNIQWFSFVTCESSVELNVTPSNCTSNFNIGIQVGIFTDCTFSDQIFCYEEQGQNVVNVSATDLIPGQIYYMFIDGFAGSICDFKIDVVSGIDTAPPSDAGEVSIDVMTESTQICSGSQSRFSIDIPPLSIGGNTCGEVSPQDLDYLACMEWNVTGTPTDGSVNLEDAYDVVSDPNGQIIDLVFYNAGNYTVDVAISFNPVVFNSDNLCTIADIVTVPVNVEVIENNVIVLPAVSLCAGESYEFCDSTYTESTVVNCVDPNQDCTTLVQQITFEAPTYNDMGIYYVCDDACFEWQGISYCTPQTVDVADTSDCTIRYAFVVAELNAQFDYQGATVLNCANPSLTINPDITINASESLQYQWSDGTNVVSNSLELQVSIAGTYTLTVSGAEIVAGCEPQWSVSITQDNDLPNISFLTPVLNCADTEGQIIVNNAENISTAVWTTPTGSSIMDISPMVSDTGWYQLAIEANNGCDNVYMVYVPGDFQLPSIEVDFNNLDCNTTSSALSYTSDMQIVAQVWQGADFSSEELTASTSEAGTYTLTITAQNGCTATSTFEVSSNATPPIADAGQDMLWHCNTDSLQINATVAQGSAIAVNWNAIQGNALNVISDDEVWAISVGQYELIVSDADSGCESRDTVVISANEDVPTDLSLSVMEISCHGAADASIAISSITGGAEPYQITVNNQAVAIGENLSDLEPGTYAVSVIDANGCAIDRMIELEDPELLTVELDTEITIQLGATESISVSHNVQANELASIIWYDADNNEVGQGAILDWTAEDDTQLKVIVADVYGCSAQADIQVKVNREFYLYMPNIFSPNGDGINDKFAVKGSDEFMIESFMVMDRWGNVVYEIQNTSMSGEGSAGWDGTYKGEQLNPGVFVYYVRINKGANEFQEFYGDVTLVR